MLGSIDANQGDLLLGWDTDEFPFNIYESTLCMYEELKAGGLSGGFNFDAKNRRSGVSLEDMFWGYILGMDTFAKGLICAARIIEDGRIDQFLKERYSSYQQGIGKRILEGNVTLEEREAVAYKLGTFPRPSSGRQEYLQSILNSLIFQ